MRVLHDRALLHASSRLPLSYDKKNKTPEDRDRIDPFGDFGENQSSDLSDPDSGKPSDGKIEIKGEGSPVRRKRRLRPSQKVTYSAIGAALSVVMITIAAWLPVTVAPLILISLCYNIVAERCGIGYGLATMAVSVALGFLCSAANVVVLVLLAVTFVPYSLICMPLKRFGYGTVRGAIIRIVCVAAFACLDTFILYSLGNFIIGYIDIAEIIERIAGGNFALGYTAVTLLAVVIFVIVDLIYVFVGRRIAAKLK